jgi:hypothetical protein
VKSSCAPASELSRSSFDAERTNSGDGDEQELAAGNVGVPRSDFNGSARAERDRSRNTLGSRAKRPDHAVRDLARALDDLAGNPLQLGVAHDVFLKFLRGEDTCKERPG